MCSHKQRQSRYLVRRTLVASVVGGCGVVLMPSVEATANPGTLSKFNQPLGVAPPMPGLPPMWVGSNHGSDFDWRFIMQPTPSVPAWAVADDFPSIPGIAITTVRWYGSYFNPMFAPRPDPTGGPGLLTTEDGWVLSFFRDIQPGAGGPPFSQPGALVGTYVASPEVVRYSNTGMIGWDMHEVWCYEVDLKDMCLAHWTPGEAEPGQFIQRSTPNDIYWLSIAAENGHDIIPGSNPFNWQSVPNNDPVIPEHFWGWHSSPENFMDLPTMGGVRMPNPIDWLYGPWEPIIDQHMGVGMAFELLYVPGPGGLTLLGLGALVACRRRR